MEHSSPEFTEQNNAIGYLKAGDIFTPLTNFTFKFVCRVSSPFESDDNTDYSGFIVEVKASGTDDKGVCFLPWHKTHQKGFNIAKELGSAVPEKLLMSKLKSSQLTDIFWNKLVDFENDPDYSRRIRKAIVALGRQPDSEIIVLSPYVHVKEDGEIIPLRECTYVWVESVIKKEGVVPSGVQFYKTLPTIPTPDRPLDVLLGGLRELTQQFLLCCLCSVASSLFYEKLQATYGSFGVTMVVGEVNRGKTKSVELCLAALGVIHARFSSISDALLRKLLHGGMPWCFDDPDTAEQVMKILLTVFGGNTTDNALSSGS
ncbi:uncharacterized protein LOC135343012 [Halichondria panicea]|uniref:uncharacterized protein LOC135343012 n=1 Tax=Halichondria panicea TaxID=6063 RepID=UPI00312B6B97